MGYSKLSRRARRSSSLSSRASTTTPCAYCWYTPSISKLSSRESFDAIDTWLQEARDNVLEECIFALIGTKSDLERDVEYDEGIALMNNKKLDFFFETSAKNNDKVSEMFETTAQELLTKSLKTKTLKDTYQHGVKLQEATNLNSGGGCC